jgi:toxin FitB
LYKLSTSREAARAHLSLHEARAEFSKLVERALAGEPQRVTRYGKEAVVIVSEAEWAKRRKSADTLGGLLADFAERIGFRRRISSSPRLGRNGPSAPTSSARTREPPVYLLDTNIVSLLDPRRHESARELVAWIRRNGAHLSLSVITLGEIEAGVLKLRREGQDRRASEYGALRLAIGERLLSISGAVAVAAAHLVESMRPASIDWRDLLIAATAKRHGLTV